MEITLRELPQALREKLGELIVKYAVKLQNLTRDEEPRFQGLMKARTKVVQGNEDLEKKIIVRVPYAENIHEGKPYDEMPDFESIRFWLEKKLNVSEERMYPAVKGLQRKLVTEGPNKNPFATRAVKRFKQEVM